MKRTALVAAPLRTTSSRPAPRPRLPALAPTGRFSFAALIAVCFQIGCISASARFSAGPTIKTDGKVGFQVLVGAGLGLGLGDGLSLRSVSSLTANTHSTLGLAQSVELGRVSEEWTWHGGFRTEMLALDSGRAHFFQAALLRPLYYKRRLPSGGKFSFGLETEQALSVGLEANIGYQTGGAKGMMFAIMPTVDFTLVSSE